MKEEFCGACIAGVAALAGVGTAGASGSAKNNKKTKQIIFYTGVSITVISIIILCYYLLKNCDECAFARH